MHIETPTYQCPVCQSKVKKVIECGCGRWVCSNCASAYCKHDARRQE